MLANEANDFQCWRIRYAADGATASAGRVGRHDVSVRSIRICEPKVGDWAAPRAYVAIDAVVTADPLGQAPLGASNTLTLAVRLSDALSVLFRGVTWRRSRSTPPRAPRQARR